MVGFISIHSPTNTGVLQALFRRQFPQVFRQNAKTKRKPLDKARAHCAWSLPNVLSSDHMSMSQNVSPERTDDPPIGKAPHLSSGYGQRSPAPPPRGRDIVRGSCRNSPRDTADEKIVGMKNDPKDSKKPSLVRLNTIPQQHIIYIYIYTYYIYIYAIIYLAIHPLPTTKFTSAEDRRAVCEQFAGSSKKSARKIQLPRSSSSCSRKSRGPVRLSWATKSKPRVSKAVVLVAPQVRSMVGNGWRCLERKGCQKWENMKERTLGFGGDNILFRFQVDFFTGLLR